MSEKYVIGYWISERKRQKFNWNDFQAVCEAEGFSLKMIDVESNLESQGPFHVFLHKLTDTLAYAERGDLNAKAIVARIQRYFHSRPEIIVIDPLDNVKHLSDRYKSYEIIQQGMRYTDIFTPRFIEIKSKNVVENLLLLKMAGIKFPFVCKPLMAHGSSDAHKMMVIFNEKGLKDCPVRSVAQDFINHNAIVYKVFIVGEYFRVVERPSLRNFYEEDCTALSTIFFNSHDISKSGAKSKWSILSETDIPLAVKPNYETIERIVKRIREIFGLVLVGVDVVIENHTGRYAIIDVNVFPGYDGYPDFFEHLLRAVRKLMEERRESCRESTESTLKKCLSDDLDSGFESDEKRKVNK